jgi:hypothetical protein
MGSDTPKIIKDTRLWKMSRESFMSTGILKKIIDSTVVICHAETPMLPLGQPEDPDQDKGVCDGIADY